MKKENFVVPSRSGALALAAFLFLWMVSSGHAASNVTVSWNPDPDPAIVGYNLYSGTTNGVYTQEINVGNVTTATIGNLTAGATYYIVVTAYEASGLQSPPSNSIAVQTPSVSFTGMSAGASFNASAPISLSASASQGGGSVNEVLYYDGATYIGSSASAPYSFTWSGASQGTHVITAVAYGSNGTTSTTQLTINVVPFGIAGMQYASNGNFQLTVTGATGRTNTTYYSTDLKNWTVLSSAVNTSGTLQVTDSGASGAGQRFYKVVSN
jgi:hypothetical protein